VPSSSSENCRMRFWWVNHKCVPNQRSPTPISNIRPCIRAGSKWVPGPAFTESYPQRPTLRTRQPVKAGSCNLLLIRAYFRASQPWFKR
jgi:hypothetical protein